MRIDIVSNRDEPSDLHPEYQPLPNIYGHVHTAAKFGCQFTFYSLIAFCTHTIH